MRGERKFSEGLPWWSSGEESTFQCRGRRFDPWLGTKSPHATGQLSLPNATPEPESHKARSCPPQLRPNTVKN